ncbi:MAG: AAA family ATPase [Myxococcota bacterium]
MTDYRPRELQPLIHHALTNLPVVILSGARQVGKSTLLRNDPELRGRRLFDLDRFEDHQALRQSPETLLSGPEPITIDEAQRPSRNLRPPPDEQLRLPL